jgi:RHS repeat-associated protein
VTGNHATVAALVAHYRYDPFGRIFYQSGTLASANVYRFSSKEWFQSPGLYYYGFRFYDPLTQRWLNRDPIGERGGLNLYRLGLNDPLNRLDTDGLDSCKLVGPFLVVYPSWWKFWRPREEVYWGSEDIYRQVVGRVKLQNAIDATAAAAAAAALAGTVDGYGKTPVLCIILIVIAMVAARHRRAQSLEAEVALGLEETYHDISSMVTSGAVFRVERAFHQLTNCLDSPSQYASSREDLNRRVEAARCRAISNLVACLEAKSGMHYGTNAQAWADWLKAQSPDGGSGAVGPTD